MERWREKNRTDLNDDSKMSELSEEAEEIRACLDIARKIASLEEHEGWQEERKNIQASLDVIESHLDNYANLSHDQLIQMLQRRVDKKKELCKVEDAKRKAHEFENRLESIRVRIKAIETNGKSGKVRV